MKVNWKKILEIIVYAIISALSAITTTDAHQVLASL